MTPPLAGEFVPLAFLQDAGRGDEFADAGDYLERQL